MLHTKISLASRFKSIFTSCKFPLSLVLVLLLNSVSATDFNVTIRKTDINELKQQLMPVFEQHIEYIKHFENCLELEQKVIFCLDNYAGSITNKTISEEDKLRNEQIKEAIKKKISDYSNKKQYKGAGDKELISELKPILKKLLIEAEKVKLCLNKAQTANELKDCVINYKL